LTCASRALTGLPRTHPVALENFKNPQRFSYGVSDGFTPSSQHQIGKEYPARLRGSNFYKCRSHKIANRAQQPAAQRSRHRIKIRQTHATIALPSSHNPSSAHTLSSSSFSLSRCPTPYCGRLRGQRRTTVTCGSGNGPRIRASSSRATTAVCIVAASASAVRQPFRRKMRPHQSSTLRTRSSELLIPRTTCQQQVVRTPAASKNPETVAAPKTSAASGKSKPTTPPNLASISINRAAPFIAPAPAEKRAIHRRRASNRHRNAPRFGPSQSGDVVGGDAGRAAFRQYVRGHLERRRSWTRRVRALDGLWLLGNGYLAVGLLI